MASPEVSVIVVNWDRRELLRDCLRSLARQHGVGFEVILVDNGSRDGSVEMAEAEFGRTGLFPLHIVRNARNVGFCRANNQGIAASRSEFVALLNNDAEAAPGWLAALRRAFDYGADVGMAACKILLKREPERIDKVGHLIYLDGQNRGRGTGELDRGQYQRVEEVLWPDGCAAMYRRRMLEEIGGFDEDFFAYGDDAELGLRARLAGWRCLYIPDAVVWHHRGATLGLTSARRLMLIERNRVLLAVKLFPWSLLALNPLYFAARLAAGAWAALHGRGEIARHRGIAGKFRAAGALLAGDLAALPLIPRMLLKRHKLRRVRRLNDAQLKRLILQHRIRLSELTERAA
ncbi:MAG: glycosyltransferase family 2 protein [Bryobacterales bacterium]|nr:glycosyltransferase family 2 protein [Bryobacteraceae bacterium]MDW8131713.1 glycosyltransferase family 2 protein [Bryobacterales bacterium]